MGDGIDVGHLSRAVALDHAFDATEIGHDETLVPPLLLEHLGEEPVIDGVGRAVDRIVGGHQRLGFALDDGVAEVRQPIFAEHAFRNGGGEFVAVGLDVVDGVVLQGGGEFEVAGVVALESLHVGDRHAADEKRVFAPGLVVAAPIRVTADVDDG